MIITHEFTYYSIYQSLNSEGKKNYHHFKSERELSGFKRRKEFKKKYVSFTCICEITTVTKTKIIEL